MNIFQKQLVLSNVMFLIVIYICIMVSNDLSATNVVLLTSTPKCGTHLLIKLFNLIIPGNPEGIMAGDDLNDEIIQKAIDNNEYIWSHYACNENNLFFIKKYNIKTVYIYRDPRDQLISFIDWFKNFLSKDDDWKSKLNVDLWTKTPFDGLLSLAIQNLSVCFATDNYPSATIPLFNPFEEWFLCNNRFIPWTKTKGVYSLRFEDLVGPSGGGSLKRQIREIIKISHHIGYPIEDFRQAKKIADNLFGGTTTFRQGQIGTWKKTFTEEHKKIFKEVAGQLLIDLGYEKDMNW